MSSPISTRSGHRLMVAGLALIIAGCGGNGTAPPEPPAGNVSVDTARRTTATIGTAGGTVSTTSSAGVPYTLDIAAGALAGDVEISMAPVVTIRSAPFPGEVLAAVSLEPSGLVLLKPAVLTIGMTPSLTESQILSGFSYEGDAASFEPTAAVASDGAMQILVGHFSGAGAVRADADDLQERVDQVCAAPTLEESVGWQLTMCIFVSHESGARFIQFASDYLDQIVTPALNGAMGLTLTEAVAEYLEWYWTCDHYAEGYGSLDWDVVLGARIEAADALVAQKLREAIAAQKAALCTAGGEVEHLRRVFEYMTLADVVDVGDRPGLSPEEVLEGLCAEVDIEELSLADPLPVGSDHSLDARAALKINGQRMDAGLKFFINSSGNVVCGGGLPDCQGRANGLGEFTTVVRRTSQDPSAINVHAILLLPLFMPAVAVGGDPAGGFALVETPLRGYRLELRTGAAIEATFPATVVPNEPTALAVQVTEAGDAGPASPVPFAVLTFTADGATVEPAQTIADQDGRAQVTVTAHSGARNVAVTITAELDGVRIASGLVEAAVAGSNDALVFLQSQYTRVIADALNDCTDTVRDMKESEATGLVTLSATAEGSCQAGGTQAHAGASLALTANPGVAADNRSAVLTFNSSGNSSLQMTQSAVANSSGSTWVHIEFEIQGGAMNYALDATSSSTGATQADFSVHINHGGDNSGDYFWQKETGDGSPPGVTAAGRLSPGRFAVNIGYGAGADANDVGSYTGTFGLDVTLTLTPAGETTAGRP